MIQDFPRAMRFDRGFLTQPVWAGLACTGIYVWMSPETIPAFTEFEGNLVGTLIGVGGAICLGASLLKDWRRAFKIELVGLLLIIVGFVALDFTVPMSLWQQMTMVGSIGVWLQLGSIRMAAHLVRALRDPPLDATREA